MVIGDIMQRAERPCAAIGMARVLLLSRLQSTTAELTAIPDNSTRFYKPVDLPHQLRGHHLHPRRLLERRRHSGDD